MRHDYGLASLISISYNAPMDSGASKWEVGADGFPTDPAHPWNRDRRTAEQFQKDRFRERLAYLERAWHEGQIFALRDALKECHKRRQPLTGWLYEAIVGLLSDPDSLRGKRGRLARAKTAAEQNSVHYERWATVDELRERREELAEVGYKPTWEAAFQNASEELRGELGRGTPEAIKASYRLVNGLIKSGKGARLHHSN